MFIYIHIQKDRTNKTEVTALKLILISICFSFFYILYSRFRWDNLLYHIEIYLYFQINRLDFVMGFPGPCLIYYCNLLVKLIFKYYFSFNSIQFNHSNGIEFTLNGSQCNFVQIFMFN